MFDLDGVLVNSERVVKAAYQEAGVTCPHNIFEMEGTGWLIEQVGALDAEQVRHLKDAAYLKMIKDAPLLPPFEVACRLAVQGHKVGVMTNAPRGTVFRLTTAQQIWPFTAVHERVSTPERMELLRTVYQAPGIYIDDQHRLIDLPPGWLLIWYRGQTADELERIIKARIPEGG